MQLPLRHLSIRVPWHDSGWNGTVCQRPQDNAACVCLPGIRETRDDKWEESDGVRGAIIGKGKVKNRVPPCVGERGCFMSPHAIHLTLEHKLKHDEAWQHMQPTPLELPKYSFPGLPFRWLMRESAEALAELLGTGYSAEEEPMEKWKSGSTWVLNPENQKKCLDAFWSAIVPHRSLCFFYAKAIPGVEDPRRVLIGAAFVDAIGDLRPYIPGDPKGYGAWVWEAPVQHTAREDCLNGFILPYQELVRRAETDGTIDMASYVAFLADEHRDEFSYATEHVTPDGALAALEVLTQSIERMRATVPTVPWDRMLAWINDRLIEVRQQRGPFPGLGSALTAFGLSKGAMISAHLTHDLPVEVDPWERVSALLANPSLLPPELRSEATPTRRRLLEQLRTRNSERYEFLRLLSRFSVNAAQARLLWNPSLRESVGMEGTETDFLENPYLLHERFRHPVELIQEIVGEDGKPKKTSEIIGPLSFFAIDRGVFLAAAMAKHHPLPGRTEMEGPDDPRRLRALVTHLLGDAEARECHTYLPVALVALRASILKLNPPCEVTSELIGLFEEEWEDQILWHPMADGKPAVQLLERDEIALEIRNLIRRARHHAGRFAVATNWSGLLHEQLGEPVGTRDIEARKEKSLALSELAESRFSVLIGPAGTGKTTMLKAFCSDPGIADGGVLLLAPTGKARVRLEMQTKLPAQTLAQFLVPLGRYVPGTGRYLRQPGRSKEARWKTVIVDEASMLTEDQIAALLDALAGVDRFVFVGDPSQLPPIGAGRPFVDLVTALQPKKRDGGPRVAPGYAELTIRMRQGGEDPHTQADLRLAELFNSSGQGDDDILRELEDMPDSPKLRYVRWEHADDLRHLMASVLPAELGVPSGELGDLCGTLGATESQGRWYFNQGAERKIESWQMLSPVRLLAGAGTEELNRTLQQALRGDMMKYASSMMTRNFRVPKPAGAQQAVYGDKVINVMNRPHPYVWPRALPDGEVSLEYVANGEIGVIIGETLGAQKTDPWRPTRLNIAFGSQPGFRYSFYASSLTDEGDLPLELAYAITVHKAQGSEFPKVFVVLPKRAATLCRELIYTALTRHKDKVIVFGQGSPVELQRFAAAAASATARRFTNITQDDPDPQRRPCPVAVTDRKTGKVNFYERYLIHLTRAGFLVRSKSEVIIANELDHAREQHGLSYEYEEELPAADGSSSRYPDFTIRDDVTGKTYYWEHLGMLRDDRYRQAWDAKRAWYETNGITEWAPSNRHPRQLIITVDGENGEIDAKDVAEKVRAICR